MFLLIDNCSGLFFDFPYVWGEMKWSQCCFSVLYRQKELGGKAEVFLDPNVFSDDGTTSVSIQRFSPDGAILAYGLSEAGSDWVTLKVLYRFNSLWLNVFSVCLKAHF